MRFSGSPGGRGEAQVRSLRSRTAAGRAALAPPEALPNIGIRTARYAPGPTVTSLKPARSRASARTRFGVEHHPRAAVEAALAYFGAAVADSPSTG